MHLTKKILDEIDTVELAMSKPQRFVFNYNGKYRSDLKECQKADASIDVMDKSNQLFQKTLVKKKTIKILCEENKT